jgi:C-terminal processing protease CtpA/Prc
MDESGKDGKPLTEAQKDDKDAYQRGIKDEKRASKIIVLLSCLLCLGGGGAAGAGIYAAITSRNRVTIPLTEEIYNYLKNDWLYAGTYADFEATFNSYMIQSILNNDGDGYTFWTSDMASQNLGATYTGTYGADYREPYAGIAGGKTYGGLRISECYEGTMSQAGMKAGDVIIAAKHPSEDAYTYLDTMTYVQSYYFIQPSDTDKKEAVSLLYIRDGAIQPAVSVKFGSDVQVPVLKISESQDGNSHTLALRVRSFNGDATSGYPASLVKDYVSNAISANGPIDKLIIDLRGDGGGDLGQASQMAGYFLPKGSIVYQKGVFDCTTGSDGKKTCADKITQTFYQDEVNYHQYFDETQVKNIRLLMDHGTASASEVFIKALAENGRAETYGMTSYGKGIAQAIITLKNGGVLRLTENTIFGPKGTTFDGVGKHGIDPDHQTNSYYSFCQDFVYYPYVDSGEYANRLTYNDENYACRSLVRLPSYSSYATASDSYTEEDYQNLMGVFQAAEGLTVTKEYDCPTLYRCFFENYSLYYQGKAAELMNVISA